MLHFFIQGGLVRGLGWVEPWDEGITKIRGTAPYFSNALTLGLYPTHNLYLGFFFLAYIIQTENGSGFLSIKRRVLCFFGPSTKRL